MPRIAALARALDVPDCVLTECLMELSRDVPALLRTIEDPAAHPDQLGLAELLTA